VDAAATPISQVTATGIETSDESFEFDVIVYATGFDAFTGAFDQIDIRGAQGERLRDKWATGPVTYLGATVGGFPNFLMLVGPQTAASNFPRGAELSVDWVTRLLEYMWANGHQRFDVEIEAEAEWHQHVKDLYQGMLLRNAKSWFTGYNSNVEGHEVGNMRYNIYNGGGPKYAARLWEVAENSYEGMQFK